MLKKTGEEAPTLHAEGKVENHRINSEASGMNMSFAQCEICSAILPQWYLFTFHRLNCLANTQLGLLNKDVIDFKKNIGM